jgi:hypothetical protein
MDSLRNLSFSQLRSRDIHLLPPPLKLEYYSRLCNFSGPDLLPPISRQARAERRAIRGYGYDLENVSCALFDIVRGEKVCSTLAWVGGQSLIPELDTGLNMMRNARPFTHIKYGLATPGGYYLLTHEDLNNPDHVLGFEILYGSKIDKLFGSCNLRIERTYDKRVESDPLHTFLQWREGRQRPLYKSYNKTWIRFTIIPGSDTFNSVTGIRRDKSLIETLAFHSFSRAVASRGDRPNRYRDDLLVNKYRPFN